jgi:hypothetical protein
MLAENELCLVLIGLSEDEAKNPYDFSTRLHFFTHTYSPSSHLYIYPLPDEKDDRDWIAHILAFPEIYNAEKIMIYAGDMQHDSAIHVIQQYLYHFGEKNISFREISRKEIPISGTQIRQKIHQSGLESIQKEIPLEVYEYLKERD